MWNYRRQGMTQKSRKRGYVLAQYLIDIRKLAKQVILIQSCDLESYKSEKK